MVTDDVAEITILYKPKGFEVKVNDAALRIPGGRLQQSFRYVRKELHRVRRAKVHEARQAEELERAKAEEAAKVLPKPPPPKVLAKVEISKAKMPKSDPLKRTLPPTGGLKRVEAATTLKKQEN